MLCENCKQNEATILLQQIVDEEVKEYHLCQKCANVGYSGISLENLFQNFFNSLMNTDPVSFDETSNNIQTKTCDKCNMTFDMIAKTGKVGCANCYSVFENELKELVRNVQGNVAHRGKIPKRTGSYWIVMKKIEELRTELDIAIDNEKYEEAAKLRDEIKNLEGEAKNEKMV